MNNGHEKLIAKIQHFYDILMKYAEQHGFESITANEPEIKTKNRVLHEGYLSIANQYEEVFKDFLYNGEKHDE